MRHVSRLQPERAIDELSLVLTDDAGISQINRQYLGRQEPTDVISFRYSSLPGEDGATAEIFVNVERAVLVAPRHGGNPDRELALYIAHGCDHLTGEDDDTPAKRLRMRRRELRWLREAEQEGLANGILK